MNQLVSDISNVLGESFIKELKKNPFFNYFENNQEYIYNFPVSSAVLCYNIAMNMLDEEPEEHNRENHVLQGDYLFSKFYSILSVSANYDVLHDISKLSASLISKKSKIDKENQTITKSEIKYIMFAPLIYLVENGYAHHSLTSIIDEYVNNLNNERLPYFIKNKGEYNG